MTNSNPGSAGDINSAQTLDYASSAGPERLPEPPPGFSFGYWLLMSIEMVERLAYYTLRPIAGIFIMQATEPGGLKLTAQHKGTIFFWWAIVQAILPIATGGYADRYGYKRMMIFSMLLNIAGYVSMATFHSYDGFFWGVILLACGTSFFKPSIQGALAQSLSRGSSSLGWGIFYGVVNVGAYIGYLISPVVLGKNHTQGAYQILFLACAAFCVVNTLVILFMRDVASGDRKVDNPLIVLWKTVLNILEPRLLAWLIIMSCFWMMMYQLWDLGPNFISDWIDSSAVAKLMPFEAWKELGPDGRLRVPQQILTSLNSFLIILFVAPISHLVRRFRTLTAMLFGMIVVTIGVLLAGLTQSGWMLLFGVSFFSLGEMLVGPKKSEYLALIAPPDKKGLYLGYVVIPTGIGQAIGNFVAGIIYGHYGEKATLALKFLLDKTPMGKGKVWNGDVDTLESTLGIKRPEAFAKMLEVTGLTGDQASQVLWDTYHPQLWSWLPFAATGVMATIALFIFGQKAKKWADMNA